MKTIYTALFIAIALFATIANASLQKPNWGTGDYWNYDGNYSINEEVSYGNASAKIDITTHDISIKLEVVGIEIINVAGKNIPCYKTKMISASSGSISIEMNLGGKPQEFNGDFDISGNGYIYFTTSKLSVAKNDITLNISTTIPLPNMPSGAMSILIDYSPPLDFMNFPVENGEKWTAESNATVTYGGMSSTSVVDFSFECIGNQGSMYIIKSNYNPFGEVIPLNNTFIFWNAEKGMIEKIKDTGGNQTLDLQLTSFKYSNITNKPPIAKISYEPKQPKTGNNVIFKSNSYDEDGNIVSYLWQFGDGSNSTQQNPSHTYTHAGTYYVNLTVMDNYGATNMTQITINIEGSGGGSGGGGTPGFELAFLIAAIAIVLFKRLRKN